MTSGSEELAGGPPENELAPSNRSLFGAQEGIKCQAFIYFQAKCLLNALINQYKLVGSCFFNWVLNFFTPSLPPLAPFTPSCTPGDKHGFMRILS